MHKQSGTGEAHVHQQGRTGRTSEAAWQSWTSPHLPNLWETILTFWRNIRTFNRAEACTMISVPFTGYHIPTSFAPALWSLSLWSNKSYAYTFIHAVMQSLEFANWEEVKSSCHGRLEKMEEQILTICRYKSTHNLHISLQHHWKLTCLVQQTRPHQMAQNLVEKEVKMIMSLIVHPGYGRDIHPIAKI